MLLLVLLLLLSGGRAGSQGEEKSESKYLIAGQLIPVSRVDEYVRPDGTVCYTAIGGAYLAWEAQSGVGNYIIRGEAPDNPYPIYMLTSGYEEGGYEAPRPGCLLNSFSIPTGGSQETMQSMAESLAQMCIQQLSSYTFTVEPQLDYQITMDFEYWAGEPPVVTGKGEKDGTDIELTPKYRIDPRSNEELTLRVKILGADNQPISNQNFDLKIYCPYNDGDDELGRGGHHHSDLYDKTLLANQHINSYGRPLVHFKTESGTKALSDPNYENLSLENYFRERYLEQKTTNNNGVYEAVFNPGDPEYGTLPVGGFLRFAVILKINETKTIKAYRDLVVMVPAGLMRMPYSANLHYILNGGTQEHPGPSGNLPNNDSRNFNHWGTPNSNDFLIKLADDFYAAYSKPLYYNDMLLRLGGKFDIGQDDNGEPDSLWVLNSSHYEHYGYARDGISCDLPTSNLDDDNSNWIWNYIKEKALKLPSKKSRIYDEGDHLHLRIYDAALEL